MDRMSLQEAAEAVGGKNDRDADVSGVFTDSRQPMKDGLFVALTGEKFDGHDFIASLENSGVSAVLVQKDVPTTLPKIVVKDTRLALQALAYHQRSKFSIPVVGLTGSVGKTTTKEMIWYVLSSKYNTLKNQGNLNNDIGMPLTLLRMESSHEAAVIEMGMNHFGEISRLTAILRPTIGVITNIGVNHIENLGSKENIMKAKLEILEGMPKGAPLVLNGDDEMLGKYENDSYSIMRFGITSDKNDVRAYDIKTWEQGCSFTVETPAGSAFVELPVPGTHMVYDALAAIAVGSLLGIAPKNAAGALKNYTPEGMRQRVTHVRDMTLIEDCYNASPDSVKAALKVLSAYRQGRRIAVLGDMLELGDYAQQLHYEIGKAAFDNDVTLLFTYGNLSAETSKAAKELGLPTEHFRDIDALCKTLKEVLRPGDTVLVKGSRGMHMEQVVERVFLNAE